MMPEMDGVETTAIIRELEMGKQIPIIALTANAVVGMREMFIKNGFNDFISKPIDVSKLDEMLDRWIPKKYRVWGLGSGDQVTGNSEQVTVNSTNRDSQLPNIPGVDVQRGIVMTGGTVDGYIQVLSLFCKDVRDRMPLLQKPPEAANLNAFITQVHALKSASASIGAHEISTAAAGLETVSKAGDIAFIRESLPDFAEKLAELVKNIQDALEQGKPESQDIPQSSHTAVPRTPNPEPYTPLLKELAGALKSQKIFEIKRILNELNQQPQDSQLKEILEQISNQVLMTEFDSALRIIDEVLNA